MTLPDALSLILRIWIAFNILVLALGALRNHLASRVRRMDEVVRGDVERRRPRKLGSAAERQAGANRATRAARTRMLA